MFRWEVEFLVSLNFQLDILINTFIMMNLSGENYCLSRFRSNGDKKENIGARKTRSVSDRLKPLHSVELDQCDVDYLSKRILPASFSESIICIIPMKESIQFKQTKSSK